MSLLERPLARPLIGIVATMAATVTNTGSATPEKHKKQDAQAHENRNGSCTRHAATERSS